VVVVEYGLEVLIPVQLLQVKIIQVVEEEVEHTFKILIYQRETAVQVL
jgi:hypothetical protein